MKAILATVARIRASAPFYEFDAKLFVWSLDRLGGVASAKIRFRNPESSVSVDRQHTTKAELRANGPGIYLNTGYRGQKFKRQTSGSSGAPCVLYKSERAALADLWLPAWKAMLLNGIPDLGPVRSVFITDNSESSSAIYVDPSGVAPRLILRLALGPNKDLGFSRLVETIHLCRPTVVTSNPNLLEAFLDYCCKRNLNCTS